MPRHDYVHVPVASHPWTKASMPSDDSVSMHQSIHARRMLTSMFPSHRLLPSTLCPPSTQRWHETRFEAPIRHSISRKRRAGPFAHRLSRRCAREHNVVNTALAQKSKKSTLCDTMLAYQTHRLVHTIVLPTKVPGPCVSEYVKRHKDFPPPPPISRQHAVPQRTCDTASAPRRRKVLVPTSH